MRYRAHLQPAGPAGHLRPHLAQAQDAQSLAPYLKPHEALAVPVAALQGSAGVRYVTGQRHHERDGMLRRRYDVARGRVDHHDALLCGRLQIDVVHPNAGAAHNLELAGSGDHLPCDLRLAADHQSVVLVRGPLQFIRGKAGADVYLGAELLENGDPVLGDRVADKNAGGHLRCGA